MLNIFKYKKMYFNVCNDLANISLKLDSAESEIQSLKKELGEEKEIHEIFKNLKKNNISKLENKVMNLSVQNIQLNEQVQKKEKLRRKNSGKLGAFQKKINYLQKERDEMMNLINNLLQENMKLKRLKKKPSINDLRHYFKKY